MHIQSPLSRYSRAAGDCWPTAYVGPSRFTTKLSHCPACLEPTKCRCWWSTLPQQALNREPLPVLTGSVCVYLMEPAPLPRRQRRRWGGQWGRYWAGLQRASHLVSLVKVVSEARLLKATGVRDPLVKWLWGAACHVCLAINTQESFLASRQLLTVDTGLHGA